MVLLFCIFHDQVATAAGLNITTEYCHIVWLSYNCYRCHFPEGRNFLRFFAKSPHPSLNPVPSMCPNSVCLSQTIIATVCQQTTPPFVPKCWSVSKTLSLFVLLSRLSLDFYNSGILILSHRSTCNMSQSIARQSRISVC